MIHILLLFIKDGNSYCLDSVFFKVAVLGSVGSLVLAQRF